MSEEHDPTSGALNNGVSEHAEAVSAEKNLHESFDATAENGGGAILEAAPDTHRGGFGEFGGASGGLIERTFRERMVLVGMVGDSDTTESVNASLDELALLVDTAGADEVERVLQRRAAPDPATFIGSGKAKQIKSIVDEVDCDTVVFDDELSPAQQFNLEKILGCSALDRTAVILDIFAQNANTLEGKAQVELAQLRYRLPRLRSLAGHYSQQAGGIGARGPGETQLEVDRRRLLRRVHKLEADLRKVEGHRETQAKARSRTRNRAVALVGYTNAGKSSLLNRITDADVLVEDRLFATLDATTRRLSLPGGETVFATDTVGFVKKLPHQLVTAFKTTLDVVRDADLLVHVVDGGGPDPLGSIAAVREVLGEIDAGDLPELLVFNKSDLGEASARLAGCHEGSIAVSAESGDNIDALLEVIGDRLRQTTEFVELLVPWDRGDVLAAVHREGRVSSHVSEEGGMRLHARLEPASVGALAQFVVAQPETAPDPQPIRARRAAL
ncbi:MAG: GTPase HflX [Acidimicrobiaceae bacterium]|nr:GTPase HflX [Acidimicrobiaceae bacterium]